MYCRKCGKFIDYDADICIECKQAEEQASANYSIPTQLVNYSVPTQPVQTVQEGSATTGLGKSIASAILSFFGYLFAFIALGYFTALTEEVDPLVIETLIGGGIVLTIIAIGLSIPGLILGIKSMTTFFREKNANRKKPIATLIVGISGVALSAIAFLGCLLDFLMMAIL